MPIFYITVIGLNRIVYTLVITRLVVTQIIYTQVRQKTICWRWQNGNVTRLREARVVVHLV